MGKYTKRLPQVLLAVFVILAATAVGGFFGLLAGSFFGMYGERETKLIQVGGAVGAAAGCLVAVLWLFAMRTVIREAGPARAIFVGGGLGMAVGFLAAVILHAALFFSGSGYGVAEHLAEAAMFGLPAGLITGLISGLAAWGVAKWSRHHE